MRKDIIIRSETHKDYEDIISLILRSFREGTDYLNGVDVVALVEEIRDSKYYVPELSFVAELNGKMLRGKLPEEKYTEHQKQSKQLLDALFEWLHSLGGCSRQNIENRRS